MGKDNGPLNKCFAGIDYGSKMAGTTVVARVDGDRVDFFECPKKSDADRWLWEWVREYRPGQLFLDAPLSLPGVYRELEGFTDYFYRESDRQLGAMSPMFLGGLTARAMRLATRIRETGIELMEVYPGALARKMELKARGYKEKGTAGALARELLDEQGWTGSVPEPCSTHALDALLAAISGRRVLEGRAERYGDPGEGLIRV